MGVKLFDKYTYLHFASGIIAYYWGLSIIVWIIVHTIFEIFENTKTGMRIINKLPIWPGGKDHADSTINSLVGDTIGSLIGWISAYIICNN